MKTKTVIMAAIFSVVIACSAAPPIPLNFSFLSVGLAVLIIIIIIFIITNFIINNNYNEILIVIIIMKLIIIVMIIIIIYHDFHPYTKEGSHVKSDNTQTQSSRYTP